MANERMYSRRTKDKCVEEDPSPVSPGSKDGSCILSATCKNGSPGKDTINTSIHLVPCFQYAEVEEGEAKSSRTVYKLQSEIEETVHPDKLTVTGLKDICGDSLDGIRFSSNVSEDSSEHMTCGASASCDPVRGISDSEDGSPCSVDIGPSRQLADELVEHHAERNSSTERVDSSAAGGLKSVTLSRVGIDQQERGRSKRKRKPKVHFDELKHSKESVKKVRRLRIMRQLGLAAPAGSPFTAFNQQH